MSKMHVFDGGAGYRLECWAGTRKDTAAVVRVCEIKPGGSWDELVASVREHQARHGCGSEDRDGAPLTESEQFQVSEARSILATWDETAPHSGRETVLADQVRALLAIIDQAFPGQVTP